MLAQLDGIEGVQKSSVNHDGSLIRIGLADEGNRATVIEQARRILTKDGRPPTQLTDMALQQSLQDEQWRESRRISELSAIEVRTLIGRRLRAFAEAERLDPASTERFLQIAEQELERWVKIAKEELHGMKNENQSDVPQRYVQVGDADRRAWRARFAAAVAERVEDSLRSEQLERLRHALTQPDVEPSSRPAN